VGSNQLGRSLKPSAQFVTDDLVAVHCPSLRLKKDSQ